MTAAVVRIASVAVAALGLAGFSLPSQAVIISSNANSLSFNWSHNGGAAGQLSGNGTLSVFGFNSNALWVSVTLNNTSGLASNRLTAFGFGIDPNANGTVLLDHADFGMWAASMSSMPGVDGVEVCAWGGAGCAGGQYAGGIHGGKSDSFLLLLGTDGKWGDSVNIDPIGFKYQTGAGTFQFAANAQSFVVTANGGSVPAPGPLALFGFGLAALLVRRRLQAS